MRLNYVGISDVEENAKVEVVRIIEADSKHSSTRIISSQGRTEKYPVDRTKNSYKYFNALMSLAAMLKPLYPIYYREIVNHKLVLHSIPRSPLFGHFNGSFFIFLPVFCHVISQWIVWVWSSQ